MAVFVIHCHCAAASESHMLGYTTEHCEAIVRTLVGENVFCSVSYLVQIWETGLLDHRWRAAQDDEDVGRWRGEVVLHHGTGHIPGTVAPLLRTKTKDRPSTSDKLLFFYSRE